MIFELLSSFRPRYWELSILIWFLIVSFKQQIAERSYASKFRMLKTTRIYRSEKVRKDMFRHTDNERHSWALPQIAASHQITTPNQKNIHDFTRFESSAIYLTVWKRAGEKNTKQSMQWDFKKQNMFQKLQFERREARKLQVYFYVILVVSMPYSSIN